MIADVSMYESVCPHCEQMTGWQWVKKPTPKPPRQCPLCGAGKRFDDWYKPPIEVALFVAQRRYLAARQKHPEHDRPGAQELGQIYLYLWQYATGKIKSMVSGKVNLLPEVIEEKASDSATMFIEHYLRSPEFVMHTSFGGYLDFQIRSVLYSYKEQRADQCESIHALESGEDRVGDAELAFVGGKKAATSKGMEQQVSSRQLVLELQGLLQCSHDLVDFHLSRETSLLFLIYVKNYLVTRFDKKKSLSFDLLYGGDDIAAIAGSYLNDLFKYLRLRGKA